MKLVKIEITKYQDKSIFFNSILCKKDIKKKLKHYKVHKLETIKFYKYVLGKEIKLKYIWGGYAYEIKKRTIKKLIKNW